MEWGRKIHPQKCRRMSLSWETTFESLSSLGSKSEKQEAKAGGKVILCGMRIQRPKKKKNYIEKGKRQKAVFPDSEKEGSQTDAGTEGVFVCIRWCFSDSISHY